MRTFFFPLVVFFVFAIPSQGQVLVQNNGYRQLEITIAINPNNSDVMAIAAIEKAPGGQSVIWLSTNNGDNWTQKNTVSNASDPVIEFDNSGNLFFSYAIPANRPGRTSAPASRRRDEESLQIAGWHISKISYVKHFSFQKYSPRLKYNSGRASF